LFWFTPTHTLIFYLLFLSLFLLSFVSYRFRPFILISILFSFLCDSYFYSFSLSRPCFSWSILHLFLPQLILNSDLLRFYMRHLCVL
jgi:hypothetical protein